ncbi:MAG: type II toxin-antitoxin system RelE/ParE family toxin [Elusimicrobiota bacterium]|jgi:mRNA interferase RelE/StbE|nr:type II toxin-antitoxin system RelE/ParE family toxin [Elusimicrobiota bacterium]
MVYRVKFSATGRKAFGKLDNTIKSEIDKFLKRENFLKNPESFGKPLRYKFFGLYRYHIGSFRVIANIQKDILIILIIEIGKRDKIYN